MLPKWSAHDIDVHGVKIHYTRTGGGKPVLVLLHGFSDNGLCWLPIAQELEGELESDYDLILPDARAHGLSARVQPGEKIDMASDMAGLIQGLGLDRPILGGHSMGASTSAAMAARFPGLVRALILEDPGWRDPEPKKEDADPGPNPFMERLMGMAGQSVEELMAKCRADSPTWPEAELRPWAESKKQFDLNILKSEGLMWMDWREIAKAITCPTLLLTADIEKGAIVSPENAAQAAGLNSLVQVVAIPGAGHNIRRENPRAFMNAVKDFLAGLR